MDLLRAMCKESLIKPVTIVAVVNKRSEANFIFQRERSLYTLETHPLKRAPSLAKSESSIP
jgi:hypothetical protein